MTCVPAWWMHQSMCRLKRRPVGPPVPEDFAIAAAPLPEPAEGEALIRTIWLSLDPYMRGRMSAAPSYAKPVDVGGVMEASNVGEVVRSRCTKSLSTSCSGILWRPEFGWSAVPRTHAASRS